MRQRTGKVFNRPILGFDKVEFVRHALARMKQRGITYDDVYHAIEHPDETGLPTAPGRQRVRWNKFDYRSVDVVFELGEDRVRIITVIGIDRTTEVGVPPTIVAFPREIPKSKDSRKQKPRRRRK